MDMISSEGKALTKPQMIGFVHDVKELEVKAFTLEKTAEECRTEADKIEKEASEKLSWTEACLKRLKERVKTRRTYRNEQDYKSFRKREIDRDVWVSFIGLFIFGITIPAGIWLLVSEYRKGSKKKYAEYLNQLDEKIREAEKEARTFEKTDFFEAQKEYQKQMKKVKAVRSHAKDLDGKAGEVHRQLDKLYAFNVVPPSYRQMACVVLIDEVFLNDQADTMREATLLCDQKVRHIETMESLRELAETMRGIRATLESISREVSMMSQDVFQMVEAQKTLLSETKSARYATEALQDGVESLNRWEEFKYLKNS